jgi:hypothetical protein
VVEPRFRAQAEQLRSVIEQSDLKDWRGTAAQFNEQLGHFAESWRATGEQFNEQLSLIAESCRGVANHVVAFVQSAHDSFQLGSNFTRVSQSKSYPWRSVVVS